MRRLIRKVSGRGARAARRALKTVKAKILAYQGRKAVRRKIEIAAKVTRKAAKAGLVAGGLVAAGVITREIRRRRRGR